MSEPQWEPQWQAYLVDLVLAGKGICMFCAREMPSDKLYVDQRGHTLCVPADLDRCFTHRRMVDRMRATVK